MTIEAEILLLSAGYGNRLGDLTKNKPKPLIEVGGKTLIEWNLELIANAGFRKVFINLFYLKQQIKDYLKDGSRWGLKFEFVEEEVLLDTGGAIKNIESLLSKSMLITVNADVLLSRKFSFHELIKIHQNNPQKPLITLVVRNDPKAESYGALGLNAEGKLCSFLGKTYFQDKIKDIVMYTGVQVISRAAFEFMPPVGTIFSITKDTYVKILQAGGVISTLRYDGYWNDVGTIDRLNKANSEVERIS